MNACKVYRSDRKTDTYLYLAADMTFDELPQTLRRTFGEPVFVMDLLLSPDRKLARVDVARVLNDLEEQGFSLQLPPRLPIEEEIARRFS
jgi:uncharacterized protein YcgL (UPF0745 family)